MRVLCTARLPLRLAMTAMAATAAHAATISPTPKEFLIPRAKITVDADLGEWRIVLRGYRVDPTQAGKDPAISLHQNDAGNPFKGAADLSARVALAWDDTYLYLAGIVKDDDLNGVPVVAAHNIGPAGWKCDSVMLRLHSFRQPLKSNSPHTRIPFLALRYEVKDGGRGRLVSNRNRALELPTPYWKLPKGSKLATRETPDGYIVEAAAPWSELAFKPQAGETLFAGFLLADIDSGEKLNQLGWHFDGDVRRMAVMRLVDRTDATGLVSLASSTVRRGAKWSVGYRVDARSAPVRIDKLAIVGDAGPVASMPVAVAVPQGQTAAGRVVFNAMKQEPGAYEARLVASIDGKSVALASERFQVTAAPAPAPIIRNPAGELHRQRPDRVPHNAQDDFWRKIVRHGFVTGKAGYERYILTHVKDFVDAQMEPALKRKDRYIAGKAIMAFTVFKLTGEQRYADWTRRGLEVMLANQRQKTDWRQLFAMTQTRYYVWQHDPNTPLAPPGAEDAFKRIWARAASEYDEGWMFGEWGYHNRCWHRAIMLKIAAYCADQIGAPVKPRVREYIAWHDPLLEHFGATTDNSAGYHWVGFRYPVYWHMATDTLGELGRHKGWLAALHRWRRYAAPSGAVPNFGDTSGWCAGAGQAMAYYELMGRLTRDGRFRWAAHRIAEYLYNHFWPRHDQYHGPREFIASGFCRAWLLADDSVAPHPPKQTSAVTLRTRCVEPTEVDKANRPGWSGLKLTDEQVPDKLVLSSGNDPNGLWGLVELVSLAGHCGHLPGHIVALVQHDAALLINPAYNEESCDLNNIMWVEDMEGLAADPRPMRTEVPRFVEDRSVTYARLRAKPYQQMPITYERDIVFVKNAFVLVKDRVKFHAMMKVRVGPCWQTRDLGPQCGEDWYNTYVEWVYFTGLGLGRGVHAYRNPAWDLLVRFAPRPDTKFSVTSRYDDNPWRPTPTTLRQSWTGIAQPGDVKTFTTILLPHAPAHDVRPFADWAEFLADDGRTTLVRVRTEFDVSHHRQQEHWLLLQDEPKLVQVEGFSSDAALALATFDFGVNRKLALGAKAPGAGRVRNAVMVDGTGLTANGQDLSATARKLKIKSAYTIEP